MKDNGTAVVSESHLYKVIGHLSSCRAEDMFCVGDSEETLQALQKTVMHAVVGPRAVHVLDHILLEGC